MQKWQCFTLQVTNVAALPPVMVAINKDPRLSEYDLSSLRYVLCGAAPIDKSTEEECAKKLNLEKIKQGAHRIYGFMLYY